MMMRRAFDPIADRFGHSIRSRCAEPWSVQRDANLKRLGPIVAEWAQARVKLPWKP